ncbi:F-box/FBD/LRR-repeat protein At4g00160-like [Lotus japonicus]|uniref:F-box/FBD/LRR-repeat protein At4g00160-like n=1 Tax=Lotus japonicus TaxID=34305 RepID=UPI0025835FDF|nr:F-box/FBD/LRR-repeat protein At4g00160-like [Lotus japonicus]XP_057435326.1 F-box/FBD/LRR-repeat protein At4g00160-like [Lotus japonicus]
MVDRISALPDEMLHHILSFLPTENAVATGVLSKRWTHLWRSVPVLDLSTIRMVPRDVDDNSFFFSDRVYSVLLLRDAASPIKSFTLELDNDVATRLDIANVSKWVNFVTQCRFGVEQLLLCVITVMGKPELPISVFRCSRTLVVLKLLGFILKGDFPITLPSLKILHFDDVLFASASLLKEFLVGCPILEDFHVRSVSVDGDFPFYFEELKNVGLTKLTRANIVDSQSDFPFKPFYNVKSLRVEIDLVDHDFPFFDNLTHLDLLMEPDQSYLLAKILKHCPKLQSLVLERPEESRDLENCDLGNWVDPDFVPECLALNLKSCTFRDFKGLKVEFQLASYVLKNARVLETMTICNQQSISQRQIKKLYSAALRSPSRCQITALIM